VLALKEAIDQIVDCCMQKCFDFFWFEIEGAHYRSTAQAPPRNLAEPPGIIVITIVVAADAYSIHRLGTKAEKPSKRNHFL